MSKEIKPNCKQCISYAICRSIITGSIDTSHEINSIGYITSIFLSINELVNKCKDLHLYIEHKSFEKDNIESDGDITIFANQQYSLYAICKIMCTLTLFDISTESVPKEFKDAYHSVYNRVTKKEDP